MQNKIILTRNLNISWTIYEYGKIFGESPQKQNSRVIFHMTTVHLLITTTTSWKERKWEMK